MTKKDIPGRNGFTLVEMIVVSLISLTVVFAVHTMFTQIMWATMKGQDNLDSSRAVSQIFSRLRLDLRDFISLSPGSAKISLAPGESQDFENASYSRVLKIKKQFEQITYKFAESGEKNFVERIVSNSNGVSERQLFGVPRMKDFGILYVKTQNRVDALVKNVGQLVVRVIVDSEDQRFATREFKISSVFFSDRLADDDWNHLEF